METFPTNVKLNSILEGKLRRLAAMKKCSLQGIMIEAIQEYVEREENEEAFYQEAMQAWENYQKDGLHLTGEELLNWLNSDPKTPLPPCHT